jgi:P27 family predicted phage terminase small subunit
MFRSNRGDSMAKRGPKPRKKLPIADPLSGAPEKPDWLNAEASAEWDRFVGLLMERHTISRADGMALALLCTTYASWRVAVAAETEAGATTQTAAGGYKQSPESLAANQAGKMLVTWLREFGLTPASRHAVAPIVGIADDLDEFLLGRPGPSRDPIAGIIKLSPTPGRKGG